MNYRKHKDFKNPSGKDWHHIIEQSNTTNTSHSVENLALVDLGKNRGILSQFFLREDFVETKGATLREWLKGQNEDTSKKWGIKAIREAGLTLSKNNDGRGEYQELT